MRPEVISIFIETLKSLKVGKEEREVIMAKPVPTLIASISFIAGCEQPERCAISNIVAYYLSTKRKMKKYTNITTLDTNWHDRFKILNLIGGDEKLKERAINLLLICDLQAKKKSLNEDVKAGNYNPLSDVVDYDKMVEDLATEVKAVESPEMESILPLSAAMDEKSDTWFWS